MRNVGLVLQGGGMRGVYTAGVLDFYMEQNLYFPYVVAVSAGACNASAYLSRQKGFGKIMHINYIQDRRYVSLRNLLRGKSMIGMDFIFDEIPNHLEPFHFDRFNQAEEIFKVGATDCLSGRSVFFEKKDCREIFTIIRASCSIPFISSIVNYEGLKLLDGGISAPVPIQQSLADGNRLNVVILTGDERSMRKPRFLNFLANQVYRPYKELRQALFNHYTVFNETISEIKQLESLKTAFVLRPGRRILTKSIERNPAVLNALYNQGYSDAKINFSPMMRWLERGLRN
jgi:predicted patatin/cPLA2 family phospholipase